MRINDFDANVYFYEIKSIKEQNRLDGKLWFRLEKLHDKFIATSNRVQGLIVKINQEMPGITNADLIPKLLDIIGDSSKEYNLEKIPVEMTYGVIGNWELLKQLIVCPADEVKEEVKEEETIES